MQSLNTENWKEFRVGNLFEIKPTKAYRYTNAELLNDGFTPVVVNSSYNNGIGGYSSYAATEKGNMITFSDTVDANTIFYQAADFIGYPHVQGLYPHGEYKKYWTENRLKFFATILRKAALTKGFDYGNKFRRDIAVDIVVKLPVDNSNQPDWSYMDKYINRLEQTAKNVLSITKKIGNEGCHTRTNISSWKRFKIRTLFPDIIKPRVYHTYEVQEGKNGIPYIVRSKFNNGMKYRVNKEDLETSPAGVISFGAENASFFYQAEEWCSGRDIYYIDTRNISQYACKFLITCLNKITTKYSYNYGLFPDLLKEEYLTLPVNSEDQPNWEYMIEYMKELELKIKRMSKFIEKSMVCKGAALS